MSTSLTLSISIGVLIGAASSAHAQAGFPPAAVTNLQVLPKTSTTGEVIATMKVFAQSLGVRCQHCHIGKEGMPLDQFDFVSDDNEKKTVARAMMRMVQRINRDLEQALATGDQTRVTCYTCHRGAQRPVHATDGAKPPAADVTSESSWS